ncbi:MAG: hypothetical protein LBT08_01690 [Synergistaceae bacterium]|nr:hypothetical protein [Synergistaceae bacterium]
MIIELKKFTITIEGVADTGQSTLGTLGWTLSPAPSAESDDEVVAAITAAISAASGAEVQVLNCVPSSAPERPVPAQIDSPVRTQPKSTTWRTTGWLQNSEGFAEYSC